MSGVVARRYTAGLFDYAQDHGIVDVVDQGLKLISDTLTQHPEFKLLLEHPLIRAEQKTAMVQEVFGQALDPVVTRFVNLLIHRGRADQLQAVYAAFHALAEEAKGVIGVRVQSAFPMNKQQVAELEQQLGTALNKKVHAVVEVRPELIAGYRVQIGNKVLDATVKSALRQFRGKLLRHGAVQR